MTRTRESVGCLAILAVGRLLVEKEAQAVIISTQFNIEGLIEFLTPGNFTLSGVSSCACRRASEAEIEPNVPMNFRVPCSLKVALKTYAVSQNKPMSQVLREAIAALEVNNQPI
jgi:hypothetical protein